MTDSGLRLDVANVHLCIHLCVRQGSSKRRLLVLLFENTAGELLARGFGVAATRSRALLCFHPHIRGNEIVQSGLEVLVSLFQQSCYEVLPVKDGVCQHANLHSTPQVPHDDRAPATSL